jgi:hypothetical protein
MENRYNAEIIYIMEWPPSGARKGTTEAAAGGGSEGPDFIFL